jgi:hypothetical protein
MRFPTDSIPFSQAALELYASLRNDFAISRFQIKRNDPFAVLVITNFPISTHSVLIIIKLIKILLLGNKIDLFYLKVEPDNCFEVKRMDGVYSE